MKSFNAMILSAALLLSCGLFGSCAESGTGSSVKGNDVIIESLESEPAEFTVTEAPDYSLPQTIYEDSSALEYINCIEGNPYKVSLEITADGSVEDNLYASESGYAFVISANEAVLGLVPEFYLGAGLSVTDAVIKFTLDDVAAEGGIDRYMVFMWFDDINTLLPIETFYDKDTNTVYARTDRLGTYCVMDTEKWLGALAENIEYRNAPNEPGNIIYCIDPKIASDETLFSTMKNDIKAVFEDVCRRYENMKLYVYYQQNINGGVVHTLLTDTETGADHFTTDDLDTIFAAVDSLESNMIESGGADYDFAAAVKYMLSVCDENIITMYHNLYDSSAVLSDRDTEELEELIRASKFLKRDGKLMDRVYISTMCYSDTEIIPEGSNFHKLAEASNGVVYCVSSEHADESTE